MQQGACYDIMRRSEKARTNAECLNAVEKSIKEGDSGDHFAKCNAKGIT
jgi:hypothetical protein